MPAPKNARQADRGGRSYIWPPTGENFWSVTTILRALSKEGLTYWSARIVAEGAIARHDEWVAILEAQGEEAAVRFLKGLPWEKRDKAGDTGTAVHAAVEQMILGREPAKWPTALAGHREQFDRFVQAYRPTFLMSEATVYSRRYKHAGTLDFIVEIDGRLYLGDLKTGERVHGDVALQLAAYRYAEFVGLPDGTEQPMPEVAGCLVLHLRPRSYQLVEVRADEEVYRFFLHIAQAHRWQQDVQASSPIGEMLMPVNLTPAATPRPRTSLEVVR